MFSSFRLSLALAAILFSAGAHAQTVVRVVHYNIHRAIGSTSSDTTPQPALAKVLNHLAPDVWAINELGGNTAFNATTAYNTLTTFINTSLTIFGSNPQEGVDYFIYIGEAIPGSTDSMIRNAIVSRHPFLATQTYSDANTNITPSILPLRGLVSAKVNLPGAVEMGVFTVHLKASSFQDSSADSDKNAQRRQGEADTNAVNLQNWLAANVGDGAVLTGDFNESEDPDDIDNWQNGGIGDTLPNGSVYQPVTTMRSVGFTDPVPLSIAGNRDTLDASSPNVRFDYLFHRGSHLTYLGGQVFDTKQHSAAQLSALNAAAGTSFVAGDSASASDHLPVLAVYLASPGPSYIATQSASSLASTGAALNATLNPNGFETTWRIELGTTTAYGLTSLSQSLAAGTSHVNVSLPAAGLAPGTTYHFRIVSQNSSGTTTGADQTFTTAAFVDSDGDGLPNDWESANTLNLNLAGDAVLDADGDGISNRDEFAAGTNPRASSSVLRITSFTQSSSTASITWPSVFGKRYRIETRTSFASGAWGTLQDNIAGTGAPITATTPSATQRLYRVVTLP